MNRLNTKLFFWVISFSLGFSCSIQSQEERKIESLGYKNITLLPHTVVKQQYKTNCCWSFATLAMIETELIQRDGNFTDLSEMWIVRYTYQEKANRFLRLHGYMSFTGGGTLLDPLYIIEKYGIVPEIVYSGLINEAIYHDHFQMDRKLKDYMYNQVKINNPDNYPFWKIGFDQIIDTTMGKTIETFNFREKKYSPISFAQSLDIKVDNYILLTSFQYKPFHTFVNLEVRDNWDNHKAFNIPIYELIDLVDYSLKMYHTLCWAGDITEPGYNWNTGKAYTDTIQINDKKRQIAFDNYSTTDDHAMQVIGTANDSLGNFIYIMKNSWGELDNTSGGLMFVSKDYFLYKTISLLLNRNALPENFRKKYNL